MELIIIPPSTNNVTYIKNIVIAFLTVSSSILRFISSALSFFLNTDIADETNTATVVVFIPPAVEPGEPPINIRIIISNKPVPLIAVIFAVLNPAVLGVMA